MKMNNITERQKRILSLIIHEHIRSAGPVGSNYLVEKYRLGLSSATVRNEMAALTEAKLLCQPHTSAGRVPTDEGYRYFVGQLMREATIPENLRYTIIHQFSQMRNDVKQWMRLAASILANQTHAASLITAPQPEEVRMKHLELIATHGRQVLAILVLEGGQINQQILTLDEPIPQERLSQISNKFTEKFSGKGLYTITAEKETMSPLESAVMAWMEEEMVRSERLPTGEIIMDGIMNVLAEPEFSDSEEARRALRLLDERSALQDLIAKTILPESIGGVQVLIGGEGSLDELQQCSVILSKYGSLGNATGTLGILGPMRMSYGRSISMVRFLSGILSDFVAEKW